MNPFRRKKQDSDTTAVDIVEEQKLVNAETRANNVFEKAANLATIVTRRDQANHWQESVNKLFSGGKA